jgi:CRP-like cAMP-binding protein
LKGHVEIKAKQEVELGNKMEQREKVLITLSSGQYFGERSLLYTEPRSATATCINTMCEVMTINKEAYIAAIQSLQESNDLVDNEVISQAEYGTKEHIIKILTKSRHCRTSDEISAVAEYLNNRVPFFQKFDKLQRQELCRVLDVITIYGRSLLFRQGSYGQGFYIILTGTVDVYTKSGNDKGGRNELPPSPKKTVNVLEGLGDRVNQLKPGDVFGERALESMFDLFISLCNQFHLIIKLNDR